MSFDPISTASTKASDRIAGWFLDRAQSAIGSLRADHAPIERCSGMQSGYSHRFRLQVGVAPSRTALPLAITERASRADALAALIFRDAKRHVDYAGNELVRIDVRENAVDGEHFVHRLEVHPTGLVDLHWGLNCIAAEGRNDTLPLKEVLAVVRHMHHVTRTSAFRALHQPRRLEQRRRVDWRLGISPHAVDPLGVRFNWARLDVPGSESFRRAERVYSDCPQDGYAADRLMGLKPSQPAEDLLGPFLEEFFAYSGFLDASACTAATLSTGW